MFVLLSIFSAQAQSCLSDNQCAAPGHCIKYTTFTPPQCFPFPWGPFCDEGGTGPVGRCADRVDQLRNEFTDQCMRPEAGSQNAGARVTNDNCTNSQSRRWYQFTHSTGETVFQNQWSDLCLTRVGSRYEQRSCVENSTQLFDLDFEPDSSFRMFHTGSNNTCIRAHPNVDDPFRSETCDVNNTASRHWFRD